MYIIIILFINDKLLNCTENSQMKILLNQDKPNILTVLSDEPPVTSVGVCVCVCV